MSGTLKLKQYEAKIVLHFQTQISKEAFASKIVARSLYTKETSYVSICFGFDEDILGY